MGLLSQIASLFSPATSQVARVDSVRADDCGSGCGSVPFPSTFSYDVGLTRDEIDDLCVNELMSRIVLTMIGDATRVDPGMSGPELGQLDDVWDYLQRKHFGPEEYRALAYSWKYGGGALIINAQDGGAWNEPLDLTRVQSLAGFFPIERQYITPGPASPSGRGGWWGPTWGRPSYYQVTPYTPGDPRAPDEIGGGTIVHPSRVIPYPYRRELSLRQARHRANWNGWGPGIVEGVLAAFESRTKGIERVNDIMSSFGYDFISMPILHDMLSSPDGKTRLRNFLTSLKQCRDMTGDGVPVVVTGPEVTEIKSVTRNVSGLDKLIEAQRTFVLDVTPYPRVVLFGETAAGLGSGNANGEWQTYFQSVASYQETVRWQGIRHAAIVAMAAKDGPTKGRIDFGIVDSWESLEQEKEADRSENRKRNAEAREKDAAVLGIDPKTLALYDPTIEDTYPGLATAIENGDVALAGPTPMATAITTPAAPSTPLSPDDGPSLGEEIGEQADEAPPATIPDDLVSEPEARRMLKCGTRSFLRKVESGALTPWQMGRSRTYSLAELVKVARGDRLDSYRGDPYPNEHAARMKRPTFKRYRRAPIAEGVDAVYGIDNRGKAVVQAFRFSAEDFTAEEAREWLRGHGHRPILFEEASGGRGDARMDAADVEARLDACACDGDGEAWADEYDAACRYADEQVSAWDAERADDADEDRIAEAYKRFHEEVNMGPAKLRAWADNPCSRKASLSREPINRNLRLLETPREKWTLATARSAMRTVSFVSRMKGAEQGKPAAKGCPSKRDISLRNWAYWP